MLKQKTLIIFLFCILLLLPNYATLTENEEVKTPRPIEMDDILAWKSIRGGDVSNDGNWFAYTRSPNEGDSEVIIRATKGDKEYKFPAGEISGYGGARLSFSDNSKWVAFTIQPERAEAHKAKKSKKKLYNKLALIDLGTGGKKEFDKVRSFRFSEENSEWLAIHKNAPESQAKEKEKWSGSDLILYQLATGKTFNIGNVSEFEFDKKGRWLAWLIDAEEKSGNGIQMRILDKGVVLSLDNDTTVYKSLNWTEEGDGLTALKGADNKNYEDKLYSVIGFKNFSSKSPDKFEYNPAADTTFLKGMTISPNRSPRWTEDLSALVFGIHEVKEKEDKMKKEKKEDEKKGDDEKVKKEEKKQDEPKKPEDKPKDPPEEKPKEDKKPTKKEKSKNDIEEEKPEMVIWHWKDKRMQSQQQVQERRDKNYSYLCIYHVADKKFVRLSYDELRYVEINPKDKFALGFENKDYELMSNLEGRHYQDIYVVELKTGKRTLALQKSRWYFGASPTGTHFLYYDAGYFFTYDMATGKSVNISKNVPTTFIDEEDDHNVKNPPVRPWGWVKDGKSVLLFDNWDVWKVAADGKKSENLTVTGKKDGIRFQRRFRLDPEEKGIDLSEPVFIGTYGEWTKKSGFARIDKGKPGPKTLLWDDASFSGLTKAKDADVYIFTKSTYKDCPDYYVADKSLSNSTKITDANPQQKDFLWSSGVKLVDYQSDKGDKLQAALFLPANYEEGKSYPTIVYIYEKLSDRLNSYFTPSARGFNKSVYNSNGYAVLMPDITYKIDDPGMSAVWCVLPAIDAAVATGVVDKNNVAIHGHSWGGYQTAFLITQTDKFKAAIAGAPLTNMISMYSSIYWNSGSANQPIFESSQGRFAGGYWENIEAYTRNSPVYFAQNVNTPLILLHNDKDGAVDWNQGIEYFNTLRRLQKPVVMLQYKGENHGLRKPENMKDYTIRMREFFDHHLKGKDAPDWWNEGVPHLKMEEHLKKRLEDKKESKKEGKKAGKKEEKKEAESK